MTTSMERGSIGARGVRMSRSLHPARLFVSLGRALWLPDRGVTELRWAAVTFGAIAGLAARPSSSIRSTRRSTGAHPLGPEHVPGDRRRLVTMGCSPRHQALDQARGRAVRARGRDGVEHADRRSHARDAGHRSPGRACAHVCGRDDRLPAGRRDGHRVVGRRGRRACIDRGRDTRRYAHERRLHGPSERWSCSPRSGCISWFGSRPTPSTVRRASPNATVPASTRWNCSSGSSADSTARGRCATMIQDVVEDVSRTFEITLVSMYLPDDYGRLAMVGVAGYDSPFHIIEPGIGVIGRAASTLETQFVPDVLADPDYKAPRDDVRSEIAAPDRPPRGAPRDRQLRGDTPPAGHDEPRRGRRDDGSLDRGRAPYRAPRRRATTTAARHRARPRREPGPCERPRQSRIMRAVVDAATDLLSADRVLVATRDPTGIFQVDGGEEQERGSRGHDHGPALEATRRARGSSGRSRIGRQAHPVGHGDADPHQRRSRRGPRWSRATGDQRRSASSS